LKITAHLIDGRINSSDGLVMLDSIIYHSWFYKHAPQVLEGQGDSHYDGNIGLPLKMYSGNVWSASRGIYTEVSRSIEFINKRPNFFNADKIHFLNVDKGIISDSMGIYRAYRIPNIIRTLRGSEITFYCCGHKDEILSMLSAMPAVAKKGAAGFGIVKEWTAEEIDEDYSFWHPEYGLMRPIPVGCEFAERHDMSKYPILQYATKPPYWKAKNMELCYVPIEVNI